MFWWHGMQALPNTTGSTHAGTAPHQPDPTQGRLQAWAPLLTRSWLKQQVSAWRVSSWCACEYLSKDLQALTCQLLKVSPVVRQQRLLGRSEMAEFLPRVAHCCACSSQMLAVYSHEWEAKLCQQRPLMCKQSWWLSYTKVNQFEFSPSLSSWQRLGVLIRQHTQLVQTCLFSCISAALQCEVHPTSHDWTSGSVWDFCGLWWKGKSKTVTKREEIFIFKEEQGGQVLRHGNKK